MKLRDELGDLAAGFGSMAATLKDHQDKLLSYGRQLESIIAERTAELAQEKDKLEISVTLRTAELNAANEVLTNQAAELSRRNQEITLFSKMNDFLQTSTTEAEAYSVISETVAQLFPEDSGAVYVLNASRDMLEAAAVWGPLPPANVIFPPNECWAHRRGQVHLAIGHERSCPHVTDNGHMYVCLPLLAQGETLITTAMGRLVCDSAQTTVGKTVIIHARRGRGAVFFCHCARSEFSVGGPTSAVPLPDRCTLFKEISYVHNRKRSHPCRRCPQGGRHHRSAAPGSVA
jgi:nitrate/nitrite-specific signal transduction histidine kinase